TMYPVCPDRNVVSAFRCFIGPDSRGIERFFGDGRLYWANDALYTVHVKSRSTLAGMMRSVDSAACTLSSAVAEFNPALASCWGRASHASASFVCDLATATAVCLRFALYRVGVSLRGLARNWLAAETSEEKSAVIGRWAAHYRLPPMLNSNAFRGLPV
ncbi:MAG TPA: hypothetical protein VJT77_01935, partial [Burkholderiales bacterium]|nr:hypothetical protein [Burkholderiales bacterium]